MLQHDYTGTFEAHITVNAPNLSDRKKFSHFCQALSVKCILIELPQGVMRSQPMTASHHHGRLKNVLTDVQGLVQKLLDAGFEVARIKIEAMVNNHDVPVTDEQAQALPATNYFEFHVKVTLPASEDLQVLRKYCWEHNAHLSTNALKHSVDGQQQRFITMRVYSVGHYSAQAHFYTLLSALKQKGWKLSQPQQEYTVYDSNLNLDAGWFSIDNQGGEDDHAQY
ncbi:hypothetical protein [Fischerella sp. JS2]|uniref:hypothetical protein n=1 Tax=Fischerella sp. JS2 TaxID=2597771 RepID=UPI0028E1A287|nr:hypothetical protein [Fischerella sp. JS2]